MLSDEVENTFQKGLRAFNKKKFYDAHEHWEDIWSEYRLPDEKFIQGLIQLSVSFVHLENNNLNGARSLLKKCNKKFENYSGIHRGIDVDLLLKDIDKVEQNYLKIEQTNKKNSFHIEWFSHSLSSLFHFKLNELSLRSNSQVGAEIQSSSKVKIKVILNINIH